MHSNTCFMFVCCCFRGPFPCSIFIFVVRLRRTTGQTKIGQTSTTIVWLPFRPRTQDKAQRKKGSSLTSKSAPLRFDLSSKAEGRAPPLINNRKERSSEILFL